MTAARRLVVLVPTADGRPERLCDERLRALEARGIEVRRVHGYAAIDFARSIIATRALADGFDDLMWVDSDIVFSPDDVEALRASDKTLIAGVYPKKGKRELALHVKPRTPELTFGESGGVAEVLYCGSGFMLTRRELYAEMAKELPICNEQFGERVVPYFLPFVASTENGLWYLGEDYAFCERAQRAGHGVFVDTRIRLFHVGAYEYGWEDAGREVERFSSYVYRLR